MNIKVFECTFCLVLVINLTLYEAKTLYSVNPYEYTLSKRNLVERRGFLQSFCAKRCQVGRGGIVCHCNGFHFAGKRSGNIPAYSDQQRQMLADDPEQVVYKILEENDKIAVEPNKYTLQKGVIPPQDDVLRQIEDLLPEVMNGDLANRPTRPDFGELLEDYIRADDL